MVAEPQGSRHAAAVSLVGDALRKAFGSGWYVMVQLPVALDDESEPEPDVAVVPGTAREYWDAHPSRPVLVVEVADTSAALDREHKAGLYARAAVPEYWIVDLADEALEVYRHPIPSPQSRYRWSYASVQRLVRGTAVSPEAAPASAIPIGDLLR